MLQFLIIMMYEKKSDKYNLPANSPPKISLRMSSIESPGATIAK